MNIYISWNNESSSFQLPINPSGFNVSASQNNTSLYVHNFGEINLKGKRGLYEITLESFFPAQNYYFCQCKPKKPEYYIEKLKKLFARNETVHLVITDTEINMYCTIEAFSYGEEERNGDVKFSVSFKEFREAGNKKRTTTKKVSASYLWKKGDTWPKVVKKKLGSSSKWKTIRKNNISVIKKAMKKNPKIKESIALVGYEVVIK